MLRRYCRFFRLKALRDMHGGGDDPEVQKELRTAPDLAPRATKVMARSLGRAMSTLVVQERHLWLCLVESGSSRFLYSRLASSATQPVTWPSSSQLHRSRLRRYNTSCLGGQLLPPPVRRLQRPACSSPRAAPCIHPRTAYAAASKSGAVELGVGSYANTGIWCSRTSASWAFGSTGKRANSCRCRGSLFSVWSLDSVNQTARLTQERAQSVLNCLNSQFNPQVVQEVNEAALMRATRRCWNLLFLRRWREQRRSFPWWRAGRRIFRFCSAAGPRASGTHFLKKEQFPFPPGSQVHGTTVCDALLPHSCPRPILPVAKRVRFGEDIPPHAPLASPVWDPGSSVRMPQNAPPSVPSTTPPFRCTTTGMSIVPLALLAQRLEAWLTLPSLSRWLTCTIRLGYAIQFARRPPKFNGVLETSVAVRNAPVLREEIAVLLAKDAIEPVPPAERRQGFYSPYFIVPKKRGGLRPILDLRVLNRALHKLPFKMRTRRRIIKCIQPPDWFAAIDLKDAYLHVLILLRHRPFLRFAFEGRAWQYRVLPFGLSQSPRVFTKVVEGALTPLREVGVRILNYLDDWLILAQSREQLGDTRDLVLWHLSQLGLRVNWEKSKLSPVQRISFLGVELDSVSMTARLTEERAQAVLNCLSSFRGRNVVPLKQFQRLLGHMASAAAVTPLGLLHMRPLQHWLHSRVPRWAWRRGTLRVDGAAVHCEWVSPSSVAAPSAPGQTLPFYGPRRP